MIWPNNDNLQGNVAVAIKPPHTDPRDCQGCTEALQLSFELLVKEAGWDVEATAKALLGLASQHRQNVEIYRDYAAYPLERSRLGKC